MRQWAAAASPPVPKGPGGGPPQLKLVGVLQGRPHLVALVGLLVGGVPPAEAGAERPRWRAVGRGGLCEARAAPVGV